MLTTIAALKAPQLLKLVNVTKGNVKCLYNLGGPFSLHLLQHMLFANYDRLGVGKRDVSKRWRCRGSELRLPGAEGDIKHTIRIKRVTGRENLQNNRIFRGRESD